MNKDRILEVVMYYKRALLAADVAAEKAVKAYQPMWNDWDSKDILRSQGWRDYQKAEKYSVVAKTDVGYAADELLDLIKESDIKEVSELLDIIRESKLGE